MGDLTDLIIILVLVVVVLLALEGSRRRRYRCGWYGPSYVYRPFFIFRPRPQARSGRTAGRFLRRLLWGRQALSRREARRLLRGRTAFGPPAQGPPRRQLWRQLRRRAVLLRRGTSRRQLRRGPLLWGRASRRRRLRRRTGRRSAVIAPPAPRTPRRSKRGPCPLPNDRTKQRQRK